MRRRSACLRGFSGTASESAGEKEDAEAVIARFPHLHLELYLSGSSIASGVVIMIAPSFTS